MWLRCLMEGHVTIYRSESVFWSFLWIYWGMINDIGVVSWMCNRSASLQCIVYIPHFVRTWCNLLYSLYTGHSRSCYYAFCCCLCIEMRPINFAMISFLWLLTVGHCGTGEVSRNHNQLLPLRTGHRDSLWRHQQGNNFSYTYYGLFLWDACKISHMCFLQGV